jgi:hypothetical protein
MLAVLLMLIFEELLSTAKWNSFYYQLSSRQMLREDVICHRG